MKNLLHKIFKRTKKTKPRPVKITYKVMLRDYFENEWADCGTEGYVFDIKEDAIKRRDELNLREFKTTTPSFDHYCVVEMTSKHKGQEIDCPATFKFNPLGEK